MNNKVKKKCKYEKCGRDTWRRDDEFCIFHSKNKERKKSEFEKVFISEHKTLKTHSRGNHYFVYFDGFIFPENFKLSYIISSLWGGFLGLDFEEEGLGTVNIRISLIKADLQEVSLKDLSEPKIYSLKDANLKGAGLTNSDLSYVDLIGANIKGVNLEGANLYKAKLEKLNFEGTNLKNTNFFHADLSRAKFNGVRLEHVSFRYTKLSPSSFHNAHLVNVDFEGADLIGSHIEDACFENSKFNSIIVDIDTLKKFPESIKEKYGSTWYITGISKDNNIIRSLEFPAEYKHAGISLLNYFGEIINQKYPKKKVKIRIEQEGLKITMIVETDNGDRDIIEKTLYEYGKILTGQLSPDKLLSDRLQIQALKNKLELAYQEIKFTKELKVLAEKKYENRIEHLEKDVKWLRSQMGYLIQDSSLGRKKILEFAGDTIDGFQSVAKSMIEQNYIIRDELQILSKIIDLKEIGDTARLELERALIQIKNKESSVFKNISEYVFSLSASITSTPAWLIILEIIKKLQ